LTPRNGRYAAAGAPFPEAVCDSGRGAKDGKHDAGGGDEGAVETRPGRVLHNLATNKAKTVIDDTADELTRGEVEGRKPVLLVHNFQFRLKAKKEGLNIDFIDPFYWAAFSLFRNTSLYLF
jgi:hypothetical protein